ncbi:MAG: M28 family metallopeptidase [Acidobacteriota bacterium]
MQKKLLLLLVLLSLLQSSRTPNSVAPPPLLTTWPISPEARSWENIFLATPTPESVRRHLRNYTAEPHMAGTQQDYNTAIYTRDRLREYGIAAELVEYEVWLPYPKEVAVEMLAPFSYKAILREESLAEEKDSWEAGVPIFNAYSASADITAALVYVNYGLPADYQRLAKLGVNVKGKLAIARYGRAFRGVKAKVAEEHGVAGLLIYSDPSEDGYSMGDIYPDGPYRAASSVQRGSVIYMFQYAGDPLTPGVAATKEAQRLAPEEAESLPKIPVQPLSYQDAAPLLAALRGPYAPRSWQGALNFSYHIGPGPTQVRLKTVMDYQLRKIWNVIAEIKGVREPEKLVIIGNHRDAWAYGAVDPNSGSAAMLEVARGLGELLRRGWQPARTILLASWDAEEFGLIGSTEWVEANRERLSKHAVAYLNVDMAVNGSNLSVAGVPSLAAFTKSVMAEINDPQTGNSLFENWKQRQYNITGRLDTELQLDSLGSGSDYTPFLEHVGVPALDLRFTGPYGVYHSIHDNFYWMEKFGDPTFRYHTTMAKLWGLMALRLATLPILPFQYTNYSAQVEKFIEQIARNAQEKRLGLDLSGLQRAAREFRHAAYLYQERLTQLPPDAAIETINETLISVERAFIDPIGLPQRHWYRHVIYAPGFYKGYEAEVFAGLQQAIEEGMPAPAAIAIAQAEAALERAKNALLLPATP